MASSPLILLLESCSLRTMKGLPYSSKAKLIDLKIFKMQIYLIYLFKCSDANHVIFNKKTCYQFGLDANYLEDD